MKSIGNSLVRSTSECYFWLANKVSTDSNEYFLKFSSKLLRISFRPKKSLLGHFWFKLYNIEKDSKFFGQKYIRMLFMSCKQIFNWFYRLLLRFFLKMIRISFRPKKSLLECYFWLANKVSTDFSKLFLKFSLKVLRISFRPKKSLLDHFWFKLLNIEMFSKFSIQKYIRMLFLTCKQVSTDSNEYFLKFSLKVLRISFRPKKSLLGHFWFKL